MTKNSKPKHIELEKDDVQKLWQSGEGMIKNPIKEPKVDDDGLLIDEAIESVWPNEPLINIREVQISQSQIEQLASEVMRCVKIVIEAQRDATRGECRGKSQQLKVDFAEYIEARKSDLSGMPLMSVAHGESLKVRCETMDEALKIFLHLANK